MKYEDQAAARLIRLERKYETEINTILKDSLTKIQGYMTEIYDKYAVNGKLTNAEMAKYNRYVQMEKQLINNMNEATRATISTIDKLLPEQYKEAFYNYAWAMDNANGVRLNLYILDRNQILENLSNPWLNNAKERFVLAGKAQIRAALNDGLTLGKGYAKMARDIRDAIGRLQYEALRILRTEGQYAVNAAQADLYAKAMRAGIKGKEIWDATLDGRTRQTHAAMDGIERGEDGYFTGQVGKALFPAWTGLPPGERVNCRCRTRFQVDGYAPMLRRTRDNGIIPYQSYEEWKKNYANKPKPKSKPKELKEPTRLR